MVANGKTYEEAAHTAILATTLVIGKIESLELKVASAKTEAIVFPSSAVRINVPRYIVVKGCKVKVEYHVKYLGVVIDSDWNFRRHFEMATEKVGKMAGLLL